MNKVILISIDGMRPDGLLSCGNPYLDELIKNSSYTFDAQTVFPSITLPCHLSMFHSVPPERHGTLSNNYVVPVRPVSGLFEVVRSGGKETAMYYGWHPLRDICRSGSLIAAKFNSGIKYKGYLAVVGPNRISYEKILPLTQYTTKKLTEMITEAQKDMED